MKNILCRLGFHNFQPVYQSRTIRENGQCVGDVSRQDREIVEYYSGEDHCTRCARYNEDAPRTMGKAWGGATMKARFFTQIMLTHKTIGASVGWQTMCSGHDKMDDAIVCNEKQRKHLGESLAQGIYPDQGIQIRILKVTEEVVEEPQTVEVK